MEINRREIYRYLGIKPNMEPDAATERLTEECVRELTEKCRPRAYSRWFPLRVCSASGAEETADAGEAAEEAADTGEAAGAGKVQDAADSSLLDFTCFQVRSRSLVKNLLGCSEVILFAATIGEEADFLIRKYNRINMAKAVVMQAAAAAMIEAFCDEENEKLRQMASEKGLYLRPRFSPGYGDFPLEHQRDFARVLEMQKTVGITLTESLLMLPSKSVTAVIGVSETDSRCVISGCESCRNAACAFRR